MNASDPAPGTPPTTYPNLAGRLADLTAARDEAGERLVAAARTAGVGAVLLIGSLTAVGGGDAFSDLDVLLVPGRWYTGLDLIRVFWPQVVAQVTTPRNAPTGGASTSLCLDAGGAVAWLDLVEWPAATAAIPADSVIIYARLDLPYSQLGFGQLLTHYANTAAVVRPPDTATTLQQIGVAARWLARGHRACIVDALPDAAGLPLDQIGPMLHQRLQAIDDPGLARAIAGTSTLVALADAARTAKAAR